MSRQSWSWVGTVAALVFVSLLYALVPWADIEPASSVLVGLAFVTGLLAAALLVIWQVSRYRSGRGRGVQQLRGLATAMWVAVLYFSGTYYCLALNDTGQMAELHTKLDAVYFTLSMVSTVGFGDVHATGQAARAVVCLNLVFNLVVLTLAVTTIRERHMHRA